MYQLLLIPVLLLSLGLQKSFAQGLIQAGPMQGYTEYRTTKIWVEVSPDVSELSLSYHKEGQQAKRVTYTGQLGNAFNPVIFDLYDLEAGVTYQYEVVAKGGRKTETKRSSFTTQKLWRYREPAPDFSFLAGSCSYFNEPKYDRPGAPYGGDSSIFLAMAEKKADFMLWLGDNWYTKEADYYSKWGLWYRAHYDRTQAVLQPLLKAMPQYAIWDDHDFGPNNFGASYVYKDESRNVFKNYWANPSYGMDGKGIYTQFAWSDVAFFLLDDRTWRSSDDMKDSVNGMPNPEKIMLGKEQMQWLKDALVQSRYSTFKVIAIGSQVLNTYSPYDCFYHYPVEYKELLDFIADNKIEGVIFMTGDRHRSEIVKMERLGHYTLYDVTTSPLTSHRYNAGGPEKDMPTMVKRLEGKQNFSRVSVTGKAKNRVMTVTYYDIKGDEIDRWSVSETELKEH